MNEPGIGSAIESRSGSGKTTTLMIIAGFTPPSGGEVSPDVRSMNIAASLRVYRDVGHKYKLMPDHVPVSLAPDPNYFLALERRVWPHVGLVLADYSSDPAADLTIANKAADQMLSIDPNNLISLRAKATVLRAKGDWREAEAALRRAVDM